MSHVKMLADEVKSIAKLIKVGLNNEEVEKFKETIPQTLDVIDVLKELDTKDVLPTSQVTGLQNVFKDDSACATLSQELALSNAKDKERGLFVTKGVFDRS